MQVDKQLHQLIYTSLACENLSLSQLTAFLATAEVNNERDGITGALVFANGRFLQLLEGPRSALTKTYGRIQRDDRHLALCIIDFRSCDQRRFEGWSMRHIGYRSDLSEVEFTPEQWAVEECLEFFAQYQATPSFL